MGLSVASMYSALAHGLLSKDMRLVRSLRRVKLEQNSHILGHNLRREGVLQSSSAPLFADPDADILRGSLHHNKTSLDTGHDTD